MLFWLCFMVSPIGDLAGSSIAATKDFVFLIFTSFTSFSIERQQVQKTKNDQKHQQTLLLCAVITPQPSPRLKSSASRPPGRRRSPSRLHLSKGGEDVSPPKLSRVPKSRWSCHGILGKGHFIFKMTPNQRVEGFSVDCSS